MLSMLNDNIRAEMIESKLHKWSQNEEQFLINNYKSMSNRELSRELNIKQKSVENKLFTLHLKREKTASGSTLHKWGRGEERFLINNYKTMSNKELSGRLGIKQKSVANKLFNLHLKREKKVATKLFNLHLKRKKKVGETYIEQTPADGKYNNLKGMLFGLICDKYIKQRYSGMLILSSRIAINEKTISSSNASSIGFVCEDTKTLRRMVKVFPHLKERKALGMATGLNLYPNYYYSDLFHIYLGHTYSMYPICNFSDDISASERKVLIEILKEEEKKEGKKEKKNMRERQKMKITDFM